MPVCGEPDVARRHGYLPKPPPSPIPSHPFALPPPLISPPPLYLSPSPHPPPPLLSYSLLSITLTEAVKWLESYYADGAFDYPLIITWVSSGCRSAPSSLSSSSHSP